MAQIQDPNPSLSCLDVSDDDVSLLEDNLLLRNSFYNISEELVGITHSIHKGEPTIEFDPKTTLDEENKSDQVSVFDRLGAPPRPNSYPYKKRVM